MPLRSTFSGASINGWKSGSQIQPSTPSTILTASNAATNNFLGFRIATNSTNAYMATTAAGKSIGAVYVFYDNGTGYTQQTEINPTPATANFGSALAMNTTGDYLAIADSANNDVYIYNRSGTTWSLQQTISVDVSLGSRTVHLDSTGSRLIVGNKDYLSGRGEANIYSRSGTTWTLEQQLTQASGIANYGESVAINTTGDLCYVGRPLASGGTTGDIQVWTRSGTTWTLKLTKTPVSAQAGDRVGRTMSLSWDGLFLITNQDATEEVPIFKQIGTIPGTPAVDEQGSLILSGFTSNGFGEAMSVNNDGTEFLIVTGTTSVGPMYVIRYEVTSYSPTFQFQQKQVLDITDGSTFVGQDVRITEDAGTNTAYIGDILYDKGAITGAGAVYLFDFL